MKKIIIAISLLFSLVFSLCACDSLTATVQVQGSGSSASQATQDGGGAPNVGTPQAGAQSDTTGGALPVDTGSPVGGGTTVGGTTPTGGTNTPSTTNGTLRALSTYCSTAVVDNGFYYMMSLPVPGTVKKDSSGGLSFDYRYQLYYTDLLTFQQRPVYTPEGSPFSTKGDSTGRSLFAAGSKLFLIFDDRIETFNFDGSEHRVLHQLQNQGFFGSHNYTDGEYFYSDVHTRGGDPNSGISFVKINLHSGASTLLRGVSYAPSQYPFGNTSKDIVWATDSGLMRLSPQTGELSSYDIPARLPLEEFLERPGTYNSDMVYWRDANDRKVYGKNLVTGEQSLIMSDSGQYSSFMAAPYWDGKIQVLTSNSPFTESSGGEAYYYDPVAGARLNALPTVQIAGEYGEYFLLNSSLTHSIYWKLDSNGQFSHVPYVNQSIDNYNPDLEYIFQSLLAPDMLILKADYWAGRPNYIPLIPAEISI